jgi:hypothetical protein
MLARSPLIQSCAWTDTTPTRSVYFRDGIEVGNVYCLYGLWYAQFLPADTASPTTREDLYGGLGMKSRVAAKVIVEDAIASGQTASKRRKFRPTPIGRDADDEHRLTTWDVLKQTGTFR